MVTKGATPDFFTMVRHIYNNNTAAKSKWVITGFGDYYNGGVTDVPEFEVLNTTGHNRFMRPLYTVAVAGTDANSITFDGFTLDSPSSYLAVPQTDKDYFLLGSGGTSASYPNVKKLFTASPLKVQQYAFQNNTALSKTAFDNASYLKEVEQYAFNGCANVASFGPEGFKKAETIATHAFDGCKAFRDVLVISNGSGTKLGGYAFANTGATGLLVTNYEDIPEYFVNNTPVTTVNINSKYVGCNAFRGNSYIKQITFNGKVERIGTYAFSQCNGIETVFIDVNSSIDDNAFSNCSNLVKVEIISRSIEMFQTTEIGNRAFADCNKLESVILHGSHTPIADAMVDEGIAIRPNAFENCSITILQMWQVYFIGSEAFKNNKTLKSVVFSKNIRTIDNGAFSGCSALTTVDFLAKEESCFRSITFGTNVWEGCDLWYVKIDQSNFPTGTYSGCNTNGRDESHAESLRAHKTPEVDWYARGYDGWWWFQGGGHSINIYDKDKHVIWENSGGDYSEHTTHGKLQIYGRLDGWGYDSRESVTGHRLGEVCSTCWNEIVKTGYKFGDTGTTADFLQGKDFFPYTNCNNAVYPDRLSMLIPIY